MREQVGMDLGKISYEPQRVLQLKRSNTLVYSQSNGACTGSIVQSDLSSLSRQVENMFHFGCIHRSHDKRAEL